MKKKKKTLEELGEELGEFVVEGFTSAILIMEYLGLTLLAVLVLPFVLLGRAIERVW